MLREELKSKNLIIKDLLQTVKEIKPKSISVQPISSCMSSSEAIEDVYITTNMK